MMTEDTHVKFWACTSGVLCVGSFVATALPYIQLIALLISIAAGIKALRK